MLEKRAESCKLSFRFVLRLRGGINFVVGVVFVETDKTIVRFKAKN